MAKILFIGETFENLGIEYLSAVLKEKGHQTDIYINNNFFGGTYLKNSKITKLFSTSKNNLKTYIEKSNPDIIATSALTDTFLQTKQTASFIKQHFDIPIILGGMHATLIPEFIAKDTNDFDYICTGEGETAITNLVDFLTGSKKDIPANIWHKKSDVAIKPQELSPLVNLDTLPNADKELYYNKFKGYQKEYLIMTSRGCPHKCSFCCNDIWQTHYGKSFLRRRSVANVISELKTAKEKYNIKFIWFMDDCFTMNTTWLNEFVQLYRKEINIPFFCYSTPKLITPENAQMLKNAGCKEVAIGVESLNPHILENINRQQYTDEVKNAIDILKENNIFSATENIIYLPEETKEDILSAALFYAKVKPNLVLFSYLRLFPKTQLTKKYLENNIISQKEVEDIYNGKGNSLALGGNIKNKFSYNGPTNLMILSPFISYQFMKFIIKHKLYVLLVISPAILIKLIRIAKAYGPFKIKSYDAGLRIGLRLLIHLIFHPLKPFKE